MRLYKKAYWDREEGRGGDCVNFKPSGLFPDSTGPTKALVPGIK